MMRLLGQHEPAGARQRIEARLRQAVQLQLATPARRNGGRKEGRHFLVWGEKRCPNGNPGTSRSGTGPRRGDRPNGPSADTPATAGSLPAPGPPPNPCTPDASPPAL